MDIFDVSLKYISETAICPSSRLILMLAYPIDADTHHYIWVGTDQVQGRHAKTHRCPITLSAPSLRDRAR